MPAAASREPLGRGKVLANSRMVETFLACAFNNAIYLILDDEIWRLVQLCLRFSPHDFAMRRRPDCVPVLALLISSALVRARLALVRALWARGQEIPAWKTRPTRVVQDGTAVWSGYWKRAGKANGGCFS